MYNNFLSIQQAEDLEFIKHIVKPAIGDIFNIKSCVSEACNSYAFQLNEHLIVKFAKDEKSLEKLLLEKDVLSFLKGKTNLRIPENDIFENHFTFTIHNMIKGDTFQNKHYLALSSEKKEKFCFDIALFMYELHTLTNKIRNMHIPQLKGISGLYPINKIKMFLSKCDKLTLQEQNFVTWFCDRFTYTIPNNQNVFGHFDIQPKNIAFNFEKNEISGIYDFGDCGFCDLSYDFTKFAIQYNQEILSNVLKYFNKLSGVILDLQIILRNSIYCILYCLMKDIEKNRSLDRGLYELRLKIFQCKKFPC